MYITYQIFSKLYNINLHLLTKLNQMSEPFKLFPIDPATDSKIGIAKDRPQKQTIPFNVLGWRRILPNKIPVPVQNRDPVSYQCTALDNNCSIEITISYKMNDKIINKSLHTNPVYLNKQLKERALYVLEPVECRISIDEFSIFMKVHVENKKLRFLSEFGRFQVPVTQNLVEIEPFHFFAKINFSQFRNDFLHFYCNTLKWTPKFRSNFCYCIFHSKLQQDLFLVAISDCFKQSNSNTSQIKIIGQTTTKTPRNQKQKELKKDGSASSLTSINKSKQKNKQKVKISQRLNLKRSCTKLSGNNKGDKTQKFDRLDKSDKLDSTTRECLNIFQEDDLMGMESPANSQIMPKGTQPMVLKTSDLSMDLRGSFEQFEQKSVMYTKADEDKLSNNQFKQKNTKNKPISLQEQNKRLKQENLKLKKQIQSISLTAKQAVNTRKKYLIAIQELQHHQNIRNAILTDKVKFQSAYYKQVQEKQALKKQLQGLKAMLNGQKLPKQ